MPQRPTDEAAATCGIGGQDAFAVERVLLRRHPGDVLRVIAGSVVVTVGGVVARQPQVARLEADRCCV
jgi:hypothetical protein